MTPASEVPQLREQLATAQAERARHREAYGAIGIGSTERAYFAAIYAYAVADIWCARLEDWLKAEMINGRRAA
jgi:hypothetical protein